MINILKANLSLVPIGKGQRDEHGNPRKDTERAEKVSKYMPAVKPLESITFDVNELWKNGEQVYRENILTTEYLTSNPDSITRLFIGNLNRKINEEQLKSAIDGITHIKWFTFHLTTYVYTQ